MGEESQQAAKDKRAGEQGLCAEEVDCGREEADEREEQGDGGKSQRRRPVGEPVNHLEVEKVQQGCAEEGRQQGAAPGIQKNKPLGGAFKEIARQGEAVNAAAQTGEQRSWRRADLVGHAVQRGLVAVATSTVLSWK